MPPACNLHRPSLCFIVVLRSLSRPLLRSWRADSVGRLSRRIRNLSAFDQTNAPESILSARASIQRRGDDAGLTRKSLVFVDGAGIVSSMNTMLPLMQFKCDTCHEVINSPNEGWLEWLEDCESKSQQRKAHSFRICHHLLNSPFGGEKGCYVHSDKGNSSTMHLGHFLEDRMAHLLRCTDIGDYHDPDFRNPRIVDLRQWAELVRRVSIPYYEEARLYWTKATDDGYFDGANEIRIYTQDFLRTLVEEYAHDEL
jgi:hypothetical protein